MVNNNIIVSLPVSIKKICTIARKAWYVTMDLTHSPQIVCISVLDHTIHCTHPPNLQLEGVVCYIHVSLTVTTHPASALISKHETITIIRV